MLADLKKLKREFEDIRTINKERIERRDRLERRAQDLETSIRKSKEEIETLKFINRSASDFWNGRTSLRHHC